MIIWTSSLVTIMAQRHRPHRLLLLLLLLLCTTCATTAARHGPRRPHHPPHHLHHDKYRCGASAAATAALHSPPPGTTAESAAWGYRFRVANASAVPPAASGGVTVLNRGTLFVPHAQVAPEAYAPYAVAMAARARVAVVVRSGRREAVEAALAGSPEVTSWALVAHGPRAGAIAARVAADRAEAKPAPVVQLALLASGLPESRGKQQQHRKKVKEEEEEVDLSGSYVGVFFYYGDTDTVVPPASLQAFASRLPGTYVRERLPAWWWWWWCVRTFMGDDCLCVCPWTGPADRSGFVGCLQLCSPGMWYL